MAYAPCTLRPGVQLFRMMDTRVKPAYDDEDQGQGRFVFLRILDRLEEIIIASLIAGATIVIFIAVAHRYAIGIPFLYPFLAPIHLSWAQELCIYMFVWMAKFGAAYGVRTGIHVGVDVLVNQLRDKWRRIVVLIAMLGGVVFTASIGTMGAKFVWALAHTDQTSPDLEVPKWIVYLAIPLGSYLMCFRFMQVAWSFCKTGELPHHDETDIEGLPPDLIPADAPPAGGAHR
jgi:C4-dicarboxylate transporter, DctQ subunit